MKERSGRPQDLADVEALKKIMKRAVQYFTDEYLAEAKKLSPRQVVQFLEDFRTLHSSAAHNKSTTLISLRVNDSLLKLFRAKAALQGIRYQIMIKQLMSEWAAK